MLTDLFFLTRVTCLSFVGCVHRAVCVLLHWYNHVDGQALQQLVGYMAGCPYPVANLGLGTLDGTQDEV